ncbi:hypothetical protein KA183_19530 [bacterium]|nr:hypothetical protein [bacterium]
MNFSNRSINSKCFLVATIFSIICLPAQALNSKADSLQQKARTEKEKKNVAKAESLFLQAVKEGDKNGYEYRTNAAEELAQWYLERKEYAKAEEMFKKALLSGAKDWAKYQDFEYEFENNAYLSQLYRLQNNYAKAVESLKRAISFMSKTSNMRNDTCLKLSNEMILVARWQMENKQRKEAEILCRAALKALTTSDSAKYHEAEIARCKNQLSLACLANKNVSEDKALIDQVIAQRLENFSILDWEVAGPSLKKIEILQASGNKAEAQKLANQLSRFWPKSAFSKASTQAAQGWEDSILCSSEFATQYRGHSTEDAEKALAIAKQFGPNDIRFAISNARLAALMLHKDYKMIEPLSQTAIKSIKMALGENNPATASFLEHWGKELENTSTIHSAPYSMYKEALTIRLKTTKPGDEEAFKGAKQIGNFCKTMFVNRSEDELISMYSDAVTIIVRAKGLKDHNALDALSDQITMFERKYLYTMNAADHAKTFALYKKLLDAQSLFYGKDSAEVKETASQYVALLRKMKLTNEADSAAKSWKLN